MARGQCLCGDVAFEVDGELMHAHACHCSICRKLHGAAYGAYAAVPVASFRFTRGADRQQTYQTSPNGRRWFCPRCGSVLPEPHTDAGWVGIPLGLLDDAGPEARMLAHIFVESAAAWYAFSDALPRFQHWPPDYDLPVLPTPERSGRVAGAIGGSCLCDRVAYACAVPPPFMRHCHCSRCRKARSAPHASNAYGPLAGFRFMRGQDQLVSYRVPEAQHFTNVFCRSCSAPMPRVDESRDLVVIPGGSFDDDPGVRPSMHIFTDSKAPWFAISDDLPQHSERGA